MRLLIEELQRRDVKVDTDGKDLFIDAPRGQMTEELVRNIRTHKKELIRIVLGSEFRWIVPIQPFGSRPPLFCIHGYAGTVFFYRHVSRHLGSHQPVYGLQSEILDGKALKERTVEEVASKYLDEIIQIEPQGPYLLIGHCAGGFLAYEIARRLDVMGRQVELLCLMDVVPPFSRSDYLEHVRFSTRLSRVRAKEGPTAAGAWAFSAILSGLYRRAIPRQRAKFDRWIGKMCGRWNVAVPKWARENYAKRLYSELVHDYEPTAYSGEVTLIRGIETQEREIQSDLGWSRVATGGVKEVAFPVSHVEMVTDVEIAAPHLASFLKGQIEEVMGTSL